MPRTNVCYKNTVIYKIVCYNSEECNEIYVGSTTDFTKRKASHKSLCNKGDTSKIYIIIRENGGWNNWRMLEVKKFPCENGNEAHSEEEKVRIELKSTMNTYRCIRNNGTMCIEIHCKNISVSPSDFCVRHGGGRRCITQDCKSGVIYPTNLCIKHGGGLRCQEQNCKLSAIGSTDYCKLHGQQYTCTSCNITISINSVKRHEKSKKHLSKISL